MNIFGLFFSFFIPGVAVGMMIMACVYHSPEQALEDAFTTTACKPRKPEKRRKPMRIQCRLSKRQYERLQQALNAHGYDTMQKGIEAIISDWLNKEVNNEGI